MLNEVTDSKHLIDGFIHSRVTGHGLDQRTQKAYRLDLEHFYAWTEQQWADGCILFPGASAELSVISWEDWMEAYLDYLKIEKKLSFSTRYRKNRVFGYYLSYLVRQGIIPQCRSLKPVMKPDKKKNEAQPARNLLTKKEADAFFAAINREYEGLDSEFRRRVCLRDMVMMELLFYHKIEISELLRAEVSDYDRETGVLAVRRKREASCCIHIYSQKLQQKIRLWLEERKAFRREGDDYERLFLSKLGKPLSMEMVIQIFDKYRRLAGIEKKLTPRDLKENSMKQYVKELAMERWGDK